MIFQAARYISFLLKHSADHMIHHMLIVDAGCCLYAADTYSWLLAKPSTIGLLIDNVVVVPGLRIEMHCMLWTDLELSANIISVISSNPSRGLGNQLGTGQVPSDGNGFCGSFHPCFLGLCSLLYRLRLCAMHAPLQLVVVIKRMLLIFLSYFC